jgi:predicted Zn-dependent protease
MLAAYVLHCCDAALARMPENSVLWCIKSKLLNCLARNDEALECADRAAKVGEDFYPAQYARMEALLAMGKFEEAYAALNAYAMREPYEPLVMLKQAEILCRLQAPEKAIQELNRAIAYGLDLSDLRASVNKKRLTILERMDEFKGIASYLSGTD